MIGKRRALGRGLAALLLSNPCNPTGKLVQGDELEVVYGAQDLSQFDSGAYTGDISGAMLAKLGCTYVVIGHSERREYHAETDGVVNAKASRSLAEDMTPIVCVGEGLDIRQAGNHVEYTIAQIDGSLAGLSAKQVKSAVRKLRLPGKLAGAQGELFAANGPRNGDFGH